MTLAYQRRWLQWVMIVPLLVWATGCLPGPGRARLTLESGGLLRHFVLHTPPQYDQTQRWPLVLALHPFAGTGPMMARTTGFDEIADDEGFIVCYPEGLTFLWNGDPTDEAKGILVEDGDDAGFISDLIDHLVERYNADPARVYVTGASNGGLMTERLACALSDRIAAAAPVMITLPEEFPAWCDSAAPVPMMMILGVDDPFFPWEGGLVQQGPTRTQRYLSAAETVAFWVEKNNATPEPVVEALADIDPNDGTRVYREYHAALDNGKEFVFYRVEGGGHTWPGSALNLLESLAGVGRVSRDFDASRAIWDFFKDKTR